MKSYLKKGKAQLKKMRKALASRLLSWASSSRAVCRLYYGLFSPVYSREQWSVLSGLDRFAKRSREEGWNPYVLRRNIHRLEKGLLMRPRRDTFALDYISETVEHFLAAQSACGDQAELNCKSELRWAHDVLAEYFASTGGHEKIEKNRKKFLDRNHLWSEAGERLTPGKRQETIDSNVEYASFLRLCRQRRSVRWYLQTKVPRDLVDKAVAVALQAPSACNRQPYEFRIFDEPGLVQELAAVPMGAAGYAANIPMLVLLIGDLGAFFSERDRHIIYIDAALAAMSFMLALETLGLSSCPINWPDIETLERKLAGKLSLRKEQRTVMLLAVGYADPEGLVASSEKKSLEEMRRFN